MTTAHSLGGLIKWIGREPYRAAMGEVLDAHLAPTAAAAGLSVDELTEMLGEPGFIAIWGVAFEDFISRQPDRGGSVAHQYLKRRGWRESAATRAYIEALGNSFMSLHQVSDVVPGEGFTLTDLVRGGPPVGIVEHRASRTLRAGARIGTRVVALRQSHVISGGVLSFGPEGAAKLLDVIGRVGEQLPEAVAALARQRGAELGPTAVDAALATEVALAEAPRLFSTVWLQEQLEVMQRPTLPALFNSDNEPFELHSLHFPIAKGVRLATVRGRLNSRVDDLWAESDSYWNWLGAGPETGASAPPPTAGLTLSTTLDEGGVVLGNISLEGRTLTLSVNSAARAARGRALIAATLDELVGPPVQETHDLGDLGGQSRGGPSGDPGSGLSAEEEPALVHQTLTRHYRQQLDKPVPALGQKTPRRLAAEASGRAEVAAWLRYLERDTVRSGDAHMAAYDFGWLWRELGLEDLRD